MAVSDGQRVNAEVTNAAYVSRTENSDTLGVVTLNAPSSGGAIPNAQQQINTNSTNIQTNSDDIDTLEVTKENKSEKGQANGYAPLNASSKIDNIYLDDRIASIEGNWNASTNTPTLVDGTGNTGDIYVVDVAGTQDLGSGSQTFAVGDWVVYRSSGVWQKTINSTAVTSVNGQTGAVTLNLNDISDVNVGSPGAGDDQKPVVWDNATSQYVLAATTGGASALNDLTDVNVGTPGASEDGQVLSWDNGASEYNLSVPTVPFASSSGTKTVTSAIVGNYLNITGNSVTLDAGTWFLNGLSRAEGSSGSVDIQFHAVAWSLSNGTDASNSITVINSGDGLVGGSALIQVSDDGTRYFDVRPDQIIVELTSSTEIFLVPRIDEVSLGADTIASTVTVTAMRIK